MPLLVMMPELDKQTLTGEVAMQLSKVCTTDGDNILHMPTIVMSYNNHCMLLYLDVLC